MPLPPSQTRVCNGALSLLGESKRITAITDGTPLAKQFEQVWDEAVEETLAAHPWNFALKRVDLPASVTPPEGSQYARAFELPADCIRWLPYRTDHPDHFAGEEEDGLILSNADAPITLRYIRRVDTLAKWTPGARAALTAKLARKVAKPITGQMGMMDRMERLFESELSEAKRQDGAATGERQRTAEFRSNWLAARNRAPRPGF